MDPDQWQRLKARLLAAGTVHLTGEVADAYITKSSAGPGAGGSGSVFFSHEGHRVRLGLSNTSGIFLTHPGDGRVVLKIGEEEIAGNLEQPALHCPRQAYITITGSCIFACRYCNVPTLKGRRKTPEEIDTLVESVIGEIDAISLTSGVLESIEEEEAYTTRIVSRLTRFNLPIGVSIYPTHQTPALLRRAGAIEVKFNVEAATPALFSKMCPGLPAGSLRKILRDSVTIFGRGHVFSNVILGLGETDKEMENCLEELCQDGVIPVVRPLNPTALLQESRRPDADRILRTFRYLAERLKEHDLDPRMALTMCPVCMGCDMIPGRE